MGAWGPAIFSDDFACDVRGDYVAQIVLGKTNEEATALVMETLLPEENDENYPAFWLALAVTQWKKGRLLPEVQERALALIDSGDDLRRWEEGPRKTYEKRQEVLRKTREILLSPMPPAKKLPVPIWMRSDPWAVGDILSYRILREDLKDPQYIGKYVLLRVTRTRSSRFDAKTAGYAVFAWCGTELPKNIEKEQIEKLSYVKIWTVHPGSPEEYYFTDYFRSPDTLRDWKKRDMKVLFSDENFTREQDAILKNGFSRYNSFASLTYFDGEIASALKNANILPDSVKFGSE